jgi:hypothetical protein
MNEASHIISWRALQTFQKDLQLLGKMPGLSLAITRTSFLCIASIRDHISSRSNAADDPEEERLHGHCWLLYSYFCDPI